MNNYIKDQFIHQTWEKAKIHSSASKVGIPIHFEKYELCQCCDQPIQKAEISLSEHTKEFQIFGFGYSLYFSFVKCCIYLTLILIASKTASQLYRATKENYNFCYGQNNRIHSQASDSANIANIDITQEHSTHYRSWKSLNSLKPFRNLLSYQQGINQAIYPNEPINPQGQSDSEIPGKFNGDQSKSGNHESGGQKETECTSFMVYFSLFKEEIYYEGRFLRIVQFLMHLIALVTIRNIILKEQQYFDERTTSLSDYSIIVSQLPLATGHAKRLQSLLYHQFGMTYGFQNSQIKEIIFLFKDTKLEQISQRKKQIQQWILEELGEQNYQKVKQERQKIVSLTKEEENRAAILRQNITKDHVLCTKMIIVFNKEADKAEVIRSYKTKSNNGTKYAKYFEDVEIQKEQNSSIVFKQAPQPNQIIWQHIDESDQDRKVLVWKGNALTFTFLALITIIFYFILMAKTRLFISAIQMEHRDPSSEIAKKFKIFATIIVFLSIFGVVFFNKFIMGKVLHKIVHRQNHAFVDKQNHSFSIKYALGMFFTTALMTLAVEAITFRNFYSHQYGVIEEETIMFFVTVFLIPLIWFINPYNLWRKFQHRRYRNKIVSQDKANLLSQNIEYDLGKRYAEIFEIMWFTFLYSELIPLGSFLIVIGLVMYFWVDKYNFLRNSVLKVGMSGKMAILALKSLDATLFLPSAGHILFDAVLRSQFDIFALILTLCGIGYLFVPVSEMIWFFNSEKFFLQEKTYEEVKYSFKETYYSHHPAYKIAFAESIRRDKQRYTKKLIEDSKTLKVYGTGRGTYKQDRYTSEERDSQPISMPITNDSFRSKLLK